jgi:hypothetical protein
VHGTIHKNDAVASQAKQDLVTAYNDAAGRSSTATVSGDLAGRTLVPGVYTSASSLGLTGDLTLNAQGDANAVFVFQAGSTLTTGSGSHVRLIGGAQACNVYWQVGSSATIGTSTEFTGNILALTSISLKTSATLDGRALARNGAVTLDTNTVTRANCATTGGNTGGSGGSGGDTGGSGGNTGGSGGSNGGSGGSFGGSGADIPGLPLVFTRRLSRVCAAGRPGQQDAVLHGEVRPGTARSRHYFEYGRTKRYGRRTPRGHEAANGKTISVRARVSGLRAGTTYHYRLVAESYSGQTTFARDRSFHTSTSAACGASPARPPHTPWGFTG